MEQKTPFVEEIDYSEIEVLEIVGKGSFGVVSKGKWRGKFVAVKKIEGESEKKAFIVERQQLSRVNHPNIVKLYGACTKSPVCLVMEYAEGGSLYNVLHVTPRANYTASHAMSWALQCAKGVSYLHDMKPKALVHRDLKPPNLLLIMAGTVLKICDFGTACDLQTHMTNNKGSAAWMAPEVFEGSSYSEKCDVFSWGIILWEVLTRQRPFGDLGATAFTIMWAVHNGQRPPLIRGCPLKIEKLMTQCWDKCPDKRPSMDYVVEIMTELFKYFKGADEPITFTASSDDEVGSTSEQTDELEAVSEESLGISLSNAEAESLPVHITTTKEEEIQIPANPPSVRWAPRNIAPSVMQPISVVVEEKTSPSPSELVLAPRLVSQTSAPPSLASSQENLNLSTHLKDHNQKRLSADLSPMDNLDLKMEQISAYKKAGSYGSLVGNTAESKSLYVPSPIIRRDTKPERPPPPQVFSPPLPTKPGLTLPTFQPPPPNVDDLICAETLLRGLNQYGANEDYVADCEYYQLMLEPGFQPIAPYTKSSESMKVFEEHKLMAQEYIRVQAELRLLMERKQELSQELSQDRETVSSCAFTEADKFVNEMIELQNERSSLRIWHKSLQEQLEMLKKKPKERRVIDDWVMLP